MSVRAASWGRARGGKSVAAGVSILANLLLIAVKVVAGILTGSISIITEAVHSATDLLASIIAFFSVRKAEEPADDSHLYGHAKVENLAAAIEGVLILVGAGVIAYEAVRRLIEGSEISLIGLGIAVMGLSAFVDMAVSTYLYRAARRFDSPALEGDAAHLRTDAATSLAVLVGLALVELTGATWLDPAVALAVAGAIVVAGLRLVLRSSRVLVDEALPPQELDAVEEVVRSHRGEEVVGFHKLRARRAGSYRHIDLHVQFAPGTSLERAHAVAHDLAREIQSHVRGADVLIHLEPSRKDDGGPAP